jgi:type II secretory pathway pseudopilin PulG
VRLPRVRITIRRMMVAVAIVGLLMGTGRWVVVMRTRSAAYDRRAQEFGMMTARGGSAVLTADGRLISINDDENDWLRDAWACKLAEKYWRLSDYPWLPVEPDSPRPERLAHPRPATALPAEMESGCWNRASRPPAWTFLWTWPR